MANLVSNKVVFVSRSEGFESFLRACALFSLACIWGKRSWLLGGGPLLLVLSENEWPVIVGGMVGECRSLACDLILHPSQSRSMIILLQARAGKGNQESIATIGIDIDRPVLVTMGIYLAKLHPYRHGQPSETTLTLAPSDTASGLAVVEREDKKIKIDSLGAWQQAWKQYQILNARLYPGRYQELASYQDTIIHLDSLYGWKVVKNFDKRRRLYSSDRPAVPLAQDIPEIRQEFLHCESGRSSPENGSNSGRSRAEMIY
ncbi:uncharacterized protein EV422DRAFT_596165 [Fimicolochytrium jonesii]|uniref:uncharacterized protein n=1 Tax=Fimicolochytrium jonesii TaxID=1396493 RepID=UPI0022FF22C8|nr:uncharacterized protein EV422DRAFT_596165 [Fimicolochytrium jonesii]KAI8820851.1 hypothetical protein EV422DRAFT_596165 [Fimicolochytrium jonesii]